MPNMKQVAKALSGNTTEDSSDESEGIDELKKQKEDNLGISDKVAGDSEGSSDESGDLAITGRRDNAPLTTRTPIPSGNFPGVFTYDLFD